MNTMLRYVFFVAGQACAVPAVAKISSHPGQVELGTFNAAASCDLYRG
jgi:hypothetical protein